MLTPVVLHGMHGIGDNLHERAIVRALMRDHEVWLMTSWPQFYWDLTPALHLLPLRSRIAWMKKNELRCADRYDTRPPPASARLIECGYLSRMRPGASVLEIMAEVCGVSEVGDFRLPVAPAWQHAADRLLARLKPDRPLMLTRPLLSLKETRSSRSARAKAARNPDFDAYAELFAGIRERYFVISLADAMPEREQVIAPLEADVEFHHGELDFETVAALTAQAALVYCSPCFLTVLAQAVETPLICVFGGFEGANSFAAGARFSPWLPIEPAHACRCWTHTCRHDKTIDVDAAAAQIEDFIDAETADAAHAREPAAAAGARAAA